MNILPVMPGTMGALVAAAAMAQQQQASQQHTQQQAVTTQASLASTMGATSTASTTALGMQGIGGMTGTYTRGGGLSSFAEPHLLLKTRAFLQLVF